MLFQNRKKHLSSFFEVPLRLSKVKHFALSSGKNYQLSLFDETEIKAPINTEANDTSNSAI